jgi:predicted Zn-dependent peptidase
MNKDNSIYRKTVLDNGLRIISEKLSSARSIAIGIWVDVGSRDEHPDENGISHFIEHMMFKGTKIRTPKEIASSLESIGGNLNAFTSRENTCYHAAVLDNHLPQAVDILCDITLNSTFTPANIEKEKSVVLEEIREVEETPSEYVHELFALNFWRGQSLGRPIMGSEQTIRSLTRRHIMSYIKRNYLAEKVVIAAAGNISHQKLVNLIRNKFSAPAGNADREEPIKCPDDFLIKCHRNKNNQTHFCLGFPGIRFNHPERNALLALNTYLGGGMSSVLFQKIREEKGIAYTVYTFPDFYRDSGIFGVYLASDRSRLQAAVKIMLREFRKVKKETIPSLKLDKIKAQIKGNMVMGMESTMTRMHRMGRQELLAGRFISLDETLKAFDRLKSQDLTAIAEKILIHNNITITSLGSAVKGDLAQVDWSII